MLTTLGSGGNSLLFMKLRRTGLLLVLCCALACKAVAAEPPCVPSCPRRARQLMPCWNLCQGCGLAAMGRVRG